MTEEEILSELKIIRSLLALDKKKYLEEIIDETDEIQERILEELSFEEWKASEEFKTELAEKFDTSERTISRRLDDLAANQIVERRGGRQGKRVPEIRNVESSS